MKYIQIMLMALVAPFISTAKDVVLPGVTIKETFSVKEQKFVLVELDKDTYINFIRNIDFSDEGGMDALLFYAERDSKASSSQVVGLFGKPQGTTPLAVRYKGIDWWRTCSDGEYFISNEIGEENIPQKIFFIIPMK